MAPSGFEAVFCTLAFVVPGFILHATFSVFVPVRTERPDLSFLRFLALSCVNYGVWSWLVYLIFTAPFFENHPYRGAAAWGIIILVSPVATGIVWGVLSQKEAGRRLLQRCGLSPVHRVPTAWDYKFSRTTEAVWVLVTLKDGNKVAGLFGSRSFASSEPNERDLYIQMVFRVPDEGVWQRVPKSEGILISGDQIRHIEFWADQKEECNA
jgi:hypothetical protein